MADTRAWVNTTPDDGDAANTLGLAGRNLRTDIAERLSLEHYWANSTTYDGCHIPGGASVIANQATAATILAGGGLYDSAYTGSACMASDSNVLYVKKGTINTATGTWTPVGAVAANTLTFNKLLVYDSTWTDASSRKGLHTAYAHGLSALPRVVWIWLSNKSDGICATTADWTTMLCNAGYYDPARGTYISYMDATNIYVYMGASFQVDIYNRAGTRISNPSTIYIRVVAWA